jgi:hypothetical protein
LQLADNLTQLRPHEACIRSPIVRVVFESCFRSVYCGNQIDFVFH